MHLDSESVVKNIWQILSLIFWYAVIPWLCYHIFYKRFIGMYLSYYHYYR